MLLIDQYAKAPLNGYGPVDTQPFCHGEHTLQSVCV